MFSLSSQLGLGDMVDRLIPIDIDVQYGMFANDPIADVAAKGNISLLLTNTGKVTNDACTFVMCV